MNWKLIVTILLAVATAAFLILSIKGKGKRKMIGIIGSLVCSFALPFFFAPYMEETFAMADVGYARGVGYVGGFMFLVIVLSVLLREWHPAIGTILLTIFLVLGAIMIILSIYLSKSFFLKLPEEVTTLF